MLAFGLFNACCHEKSTWFSVPWRFVRIWQQITKSGVYYGLASTILYRRIGGAEPFLQMKNGSAWTALMVLRVFGQTGASTRKCLQRARAVGVVWWCGQGFVRKGDCAGSCKRKFELRRVYFYVGRAFITVHKGKIPARIHFPTRRCSCSHLTSDAGLV